MILAIKTEVLIKTKAEDDVHFRNGHQITRITFTSTATPTVERKKK